MSELLKRSVAAWMIACLAAGTGGAAARVVKVPPGTPVFGELDEKVTSRIEKDGWDEGDNVRAHVWRDVVVEGVVVVKAGTPMMVRIDTIKKAKMAGIKGKLELEAVSATTADGQQVLLDGGYDKSGHSRMGLSISLAAVVAWPLIFIKGKAAVLESGTVFDAATSSPLDIDVSSDAPRKVKLGASGMTATVLYDEMDPSGKDRVLPVTLANCSGGLSGASVSSINGKAVASIPVVLGAVADDGGCKSARCTIDLKQLGEHFGKGINRFEVAAGDATAEIVMDIEL